jgi:hypothetical protein
MALQRKLKSKNVMVAETSKIVEKKHGRAFEHGHQVMMLNSYDKGNIGMVTEYYPGYYIVETEPEKTVYHEVPAFSTVLIEGPKNVGQRMTTMQSKVIRLVSLKDGSFGHVVAENEQSYTIHAIKQSGIKIEELLDLVIKKQVNISDDHIEVAKSDITNYYDVIIDRTDISLKTLEPEVYYYGKVVHTIPGYVESTKIPAKLSSFKPKQVQKLSENSIKIDQQVYRNFEYHPAHLAIESNGRLLKHTLFNVGTSESPRYIKRDITPNDIFYYDVRVFGEDAQVISVNEDGTFNAKLLSGNNFQMVNNIDKKEVQKMHSGFKWLGGTGDAEGVEGVEGDREGEAEQEYADNEGDREGFDADEEGAEGEISGYAEGDEGDEGEEREVEGEAEGAHEGAPEGVEGAEAVASFADMSRLNKEESILTSDQKTFKNMIVTIMTKAGINQNAIDPFELAVIADKLNTDLTKEMNQIISGTRAINYIIAALVFVELVQKGYRIIDPEFGLSKFFKKLMEAKYFKEKDFSSDSILLTDIAQMIQSQESFDTQQKNIDSLKRTKQFDKLLQIMFSNAFALIRSKLQSLVEPEVKEAFMPQLRPLGARKRALLLEEPVDTSKQAYEITSKYMITVKHILKGLTLPEKEVPIIWGADLKPLIEKFKAKLNEKYVEDGSMDDQYLFMIDNFERGPFVLRDLKESENADYFSFIYDLFIKTVEKFIAKETHKRECLKKEHEELLERRSKMAKPMEIDDVMPEIPNTSAYMKEQRIRQQKADIARLTRKIRNVKV